MLLYDFLHPSTTYLLQAIDRGWTETLVRGCTTTFLPTSRHCDYRHEHRRPCCRDYYGHSKTHQKAPAPSTFREDPIPWCGVPLFRPPIRGPRHALPPGDYCQNQCQGQRHRNCIFLRNITQKRLPGNNSAKNGPWASVSRRIPAYIPKLHLSSSMGR